MSRRSVFASRLLRVAVATGIAVIPGCALYFGDGSNDDFHEPNVDDLHDPDGSGSGSGSGSDWDPGAGSYVFARCEDRVVRRIQTDLPPGDMPGHGAGATIGLCEDPCQSAIAECSNGDCTSAFGTVCGAPSAKGAPTTLQGSACTTSDSVTYGETTKCGQAVPGGTCTCDSDSRFDCTPATSTAAVHSSLVGKWRGMVTPPDFTTPYPVSLWIYPDGTYWGECTQGPSYCNAFYYGGDGPHPWRRINVLSTSAATGAYADIGLFYSFNVGALSSLYVSATTLTFTYNAAWHSCGQPFSFQLTRE